MTLTSTKFVFFIVLVQLLWLLWQLEVSIVLYGEKWELSISVVSLGIFEFYFYMNIYSVALHDFMRLLFKLLDLIGCYVNINEEFLRKKNQTTFSLSQIFYSQVSDRCPWATCFEFVISLPKELILHPHFHRPNVT